MLPFQNACYGYIREHPFNLKGVGGAMCFFLEKISVRKFDGKKILSLTWAENDILKAFKKLFL